MFINEIDVHYLDRVMGSDDEQAPRIHTVESKFD